MMAARDLAARLTPAGGRTKPTSAQSMLKYTLLMTVDDADALDHLLLRIRRTHGRRVTKSQLIRSLLGLALEDSSLLAQAIEKERT